MQKIHLITLYAAITLSVLSVVFSVYIQFSSPQVAFIESNVLMNDYVKAQESQNKLEEKVSEWEKNIKTLQRELQSLNKETLEKSESWSEGERQEHAELVQTKQEEYARYTRAINEKAQKLEQELMQPVYNAINAQIKKYGEEKGYDIVFGTVSGGNILYGEDAVNVTQDFLKYINANS